MLGRCYLIGAKLLHGSVDIQQSKAIVLPFLLYYPYHPFFKFSFIDLSNCMMHSLAYDSITGLSRSVKLTTIALLALIKFSGVIMISSPHCPAPVPRMGSLRRFASRKDLKPDGCQ